MKKYIIITTLTLLALLVGLCTRKADAVSAEKSYPVDPLIGTGGHGHVFVGANVPHGMISVGPNNETLGWDWCSGYHDTDSTIIGFAQNHLSGTGVADLGEILLMPYLGEPTFEAVVFDKKEQTVKPGYYSVKLMDGAISVELTATERVAYHKYSKESDSTLVVALDLETATKSLMFRDGRQESEITTVDEYTVAGYRMSSEWARDHKVYYAVRFNQPIAQTMGENPKVAFAFGDVKVVEATVALSYNSVEAALANLEAEGGKKFADVLADAKGKWNSQLSTIDFKGLDATIDTIFYTSLYHTAFAPQLFSDVNQADEYTIFSTWDTYRAVHPLYTIIDPKAGDYVNSMINISKTTGRLPVWPLAGFETDCMVGVHSVPIIADAALKGVAGVDAKEALEEIKKFASQPVEGLEFIDAKGYMPANKVNWSVSRALEYCIDDDAVARLAAACGDEETAAYYAARSNNYRHYFDPNTGYMRGKLANGKFREPFDPSFSLHEEADYVEGNAWQYTWLVPHDPHGLIALFGGEEAFLKQLDALFLADEALNDGASIDITGMIGQYAHGNEPSHHTLYLYTYAGQQHKTAEKIRQVCSEFYTTQPDGLIGNEDCGQMSAWYVFSTLGFYPVHPTAGVYVFGSPLCHEAVLHTVNGTDFKIVAKNNSSENKYIQSVTLNGQPYTKSWISHEDIMKGGEIVFEMGPQPSEFGAAKEDRPSAEEIKY